MTTLDLHGPRVSGFSSSAVATSIAAGIWRAVVNARMRRAAVLVSFYSAK